ncbi:sulfatase [Algibacter pectinivorans]|uniref:Arylsulfatase A n=1 Tax=Algibacter pectinivorans TaxID=870482 RepID=A0A1I1R192_9FLAO|nr:sulfatase [Algibacter pectinivorans]SFD27997.1 Arylsulfatase A [Algibacter pectinivorans]
MNKYVTFVLGLTFLFTSCKNEKNKTAETQAQKPMNVLFIAIDDLRTELGVYGAPQVKSPNIDQFAKEALVFNRAYCNVPVCGASRASLLTSILPTKTRFVDFRAKAQEDVPNAKTLPSVFKDAGYTSISNGKIFHYNKDAQESSWSENPWMPEGGHAVSYDPETKKVIMKSGNGRVYEAPEVSERVYPDYKIAQKTIKDLRRFKETGESFFMACGFFRPHMPFYAPKKYWDLYDRDSIAIANNRYLPENAPSSLRGSGEFKTYNFGEYEPGTEEFHKMMRHGYYACVSYVDQLVGEVLSELENLGLAENTVVVLWGDHGWHLGEHEFWGKHNTLHNALQVPLIVKVPGKAKGQQTKALIESVDIYPTLCDLANLDAPDYIMGESFASVLDNPEQSFRESVYARFKKADAIVTEKFTYSLYENGEEMLFDIKQDPQENKNIVADLENKSVLKNMQSDLKKKIELATSYK